ncbi:LysM peptidoglycan-binding domain-containing protein [uncultured Vagococcus sp.]|uniref:LysM peptidoglycan-binding domain-containing protein n=1 Tax=uncultured Vagococcus sp. TaxID=189676 RepID=UPI0028D20EEF|nr:LysM peptidoglycan-binding domain-containing protein [uncultured Vagococcus sp.]
MQSSRRSQRMQPATNQPHWSVVVIGVLLVLISVLMCYLIVTTVSQSVKLSSIQTKLTKMDQPVSSEAGQVADKQSTTPVQETSSSTNQTSNMDQIQGQAQNEQAQLPETSTGVYVVKAGDTLSSIADQFGTSVEGLMSQNGLSSNILQIGQELNH